MAIKTARFLVVSILTLGALPMGSIASTDHFDTPGSAEVILSQKTKVHLKAPGDTLTIADPTIFPYGGKYYLIGTSGDHSVNRGFKAFASKDLLHWHRVTAPGQPNYLVLDSAQSFGNKGFWAPQLLLPPGAGKKKAAPKTVLMAYTANEQIAIAGSINGIIGPFTQKLNNTNSQASKTGNGFTKLFTDSFKHIDPFIFTDPVTGKHYIYYVKLDKGNNIYVSELKLDQHGSIHVQKGTERPCIHATAHWENTAGSSWPVTEGPTVLYHNGYYYIFYSANDFRNVDYAVGYATSTSPIGPWAKSKDSPLISRSLTGLNGTGHGDVFQDKNGHFYYVFHAHNGPQRVGPRKTFLIGFAFTQNKNAEQPDKIKMDFSSVHPLLVSKEKQWEQ